MAMASSVLSSVASLIVGGGAGGGVDTTALLRVQDTSHLLQDCATHYTHYTNTYIYSYMQCQG